MVRPWKLGCAMQHRDVEPFLRLADGVGGLRSQRRCSSGHTTGCSTLPFCTCGNIRSSLTGSFLVLSTPSVLSSLDFIMIHFALPLLAACSSVLAAKNPACSSGVYSKLAAYSTIKPVSSFCLSKFPPQTQTTVVTATARATVTSTITT